jgi:C4-type Zn-finger protein
MEMQGVTRMLLTSIPYFKEIIVSSFRCEHCGHRDTEIQSAGEIQRECLQIDATGGGGFEPRRM